MITKIHLENFKGIKERQTIELKPITLLFGPNSAGKSTIIQAMHYGREILEHQNFDPDSKIHGGDGMDLGGFRNLVHGHDFRNNVILLRFDINIDGVSLPDINPVTADIDYERDVYQKKIAVDAKTAWITIKIQWSSLRNKPIITLYETGFNDNVVARITPSKPMDDAQYEISFINFRHPFFNIKNTLKYLKEYESHSYARKSIKLSEELDGFIDFDKDKGTIRIPLESQESGIPSFISGIIFDYNIFEIVEEDGIELGGPDKWHAMECYFELLNKVLVAPGLLLKEELNTFRYIGPIREIPPRTFIPNKIINGKRWENGLGAWDLLYKRPPEFLKKVNTWMDLLNTGHNIKMKFYKELLLDSALMQFINQDLAFDNIDLKKEINEIPVRQQICLVGKHTPIELMPCDIGVGISQLIPVVVGAIDQSSSILAVEQPELHVHPAVQVNLGDLFISQIQDKDCIFLLETHSEHLMLRLLRRIEETSNEELPLGKWPLQPDQVSVMYFEHTKDVTKITHIPVDETGEFTKPWPKGFFEERAEELFR